MAGGLYIYVGTQYSYQTLVPLVSKIQERDRQRDRERTIRAAGLQRVNLRRIRAAGLQRVNLRRMKTASPGLLRCGWYLRMPGGNAPPDPPSVCDVPFFFCKMSGKTFLAGW